MRFPGGRTLFFWLLTLAPLAAQPMVLDAGFAPAVEQGYPAIRGARYLAGPDRRLIVLTFAGSTYVNDVVMPHGIARLLADGSRDPGFTARLGNGELVQDAAALPDGRVMAYVGSNLESAPGRIVQLLANGQVDPTFSPVIVVGLRGAATSAPRARLTRLGDGSTIAWGAFDSVGGFARNGLARILANGAVDALFAPALSDARLEVESLVATPDDRVVFTGVSYRTNGVRYYFNRLTRTGEIDPTFAPAPPSITFPLIAVLPDQRVLTAHSQLRRLNADGSVDPTFNPQIPQLQSIRHAALLPDGRIAVEADTGTGPPSDSPIKSVFVLRADGALDRDVRTLPGAERIHQLKAVRSDGSIALVQGPLIREPFYWELSVAYMPGMTDPKLAVLTPPADALTVLPTRMEVTGSSNVRRLSLDASGRVRVEGGFTRIAGVSRNGYARFNRDGTIDPTFTPPAVNALYHQPDGRIIGTQATFGPADANGFHAETTRLVRLNPDGTLDPGFVPAADLDLAGANWLATAADGRTLICAFDGAREEKNLRLIWLQPNGSRSTTLATTFAGVLGGPVFSSVVVVPIGGGSPGVVQSAAILPDGKLLLRVLSQFINGQPATLLVRLNPDGTTDSSYRPSATPLRDISKARPLPDGRADVTGTRDEVDSTTHGAVLRLKPDGSPDTFVEPALAEGLPLADGSFLHELARFHPDGTRDLNFRLSIDYGYQLTSAVLAPDGSLWIGGFFSQVNGQPRHGLARLVPAEVPGFTVQPLTQRTWVGLDLTLAAELGTAAPATYQWTFNGGPIPGATSRTLRITRPALSAAGDYRLVATVGGVTYTSAPATLTVIPNTTRLVNFSGRGLVARSSPQIVGVVLRNAAPRSLLLRSIGRGVPVDHHSLSLLPDPVLTLYRGGALIAQDTGSALTPPIVQLADSLGAFKPRDLFPDAALVIPLSAGAYTAHTNSLNGNTGVTLLEFYDAEPANETPLAANFSVFGRAAPANGVLIAGFVVVGNGRIRLLIRGVGPGLAAFGVPGALADPAITLFRQDRLLLSSDDWSDQVGTDELVLTAQQAGAFPLSPGSRDAAMIVSLDPGIYTVHGGAKDSQVGEMMIEVYILDY
jgi:uncharacterized delta-60 repeat protein